MAVGVLSAFSRHPFGEVRGTKRLCVISSDPDSSVSYQSNFRVVAMKMQELKQSRLEPLYYNFVDTATSKLNFVQEGALLVLKFLDDPI